jgi:hypothetical protein
LDAPRQIVLEGEAVNEELVDVPPRIVKLSTCVQRVGPGELTLIYCPLFGAIKENTLLIQTALVGTGPVYIIVPKAPGTVESPNRIGTPGK